jgi:hypothetical protein
MISEMWRCRRCASARFHWQGNAVIATDSLTGSTPLFAGHPRTMPTPPGLK